MRDEELPVLEVLSIELLSRETSKGTLNQQHYSLSTLNEECFDGKERIGSLLMSYCYSSVTHCLLSDLSI